jgi:hypothetical protein
MRRCDMCGSVIPPESNVCPSCGGIVSDEAPGNERLVGNVEWGEINIDLSRMPGDKESLLGTIRACWNDLEAHSSQRLFAGQLSDLSRSTLRLVLYGPRESFVRLCENLKFAVDEDSVVTFRPMLLNEIYRIRDHKD